MWEWRKSCKLLSTRHYELYSFFTRKQGEDDKEVKIVAVDLQAMAPLPGVVQIQGDITKVRCIIHLTSWIQSTCKVNYRELFHYIEQLTIPQLTYLIFHCMPYKVVPHTSKSTWIHTRMHTTYKCHICNMLVVKWLPLVTVTPGGISSPATLSRYRWWKLDLP